MKRDAGLSPHLWGTPEIGRAQTGAPRFIPTPVGNTARRSPGRLFTSVYPHTCGEHAPPITASVVTFGLSPHLWGTLLRLGGTLRFVRFIPTPVGNTAGRPGPRPSCSVYPHTCGEHITTARLTGTCCGLSPHLWGTHRSPERAGGQQRFIPTPVGNTTCAALGRRWRAVYPHTCGEHRPKAGRIVQGRGLSPHLWGTPSPDGRGSAGSRFIPTPVGNTFLM